MIRTVVAIVLILLSLGVEGFNLYTYLRNLIDYNRRIEIYALRENTLRLEYFQVVNDRVGITSTLYQIKDDAVSLNDSTLMALADSLKATAESGNFGRYTQAILSYTEDYLAQPVPRLPLWSVIGGFIFGILGVLLVIADILSFRRGVEEIVRYIQNVRMGILSNRSPVGGDFSVVGEALAELSEDLDRTRRNARQLIQP